MTTNIVPDLVPDLDRYRIRFLEQLLAEATAIHWQRRARTFDEAAPRADDYHGRATPTEVAEAGQRCRATAEACRAHAAMLRADGMPEVAREALQILAESEPGRAVA